MLCRKPYMIGNVPVGCGQCVPCRVNRRRQWMWRQFLESLCHRENCFVTLTYGRGKEPGNPEHHPHVGNLQPEDVSLWLKKFRFRISPIRCRYFLVGEYGERSGRPHYHLSLFGVSGLTVVPLPSGNTTVERIIAETWTHGFVQVAEFNELTAQYVAGYVVKKLTGAGDVRLKGRRPEFARMSLRPGIGADAMRIVAGAMSADGKASPVVDATGDVPTQLRVGRRSIPLGRYLLRRLRRDFGFSDEYVAALKGRLFHERSVEMSALLSAAIGNEPLATSKAVYLKEVKQKILNVESRSKLWKKRSTL